MLRQPLGKKKKEDFNYNKYQVLQLRSKYSSESQNQSIMEPERSLSPDRERRPLPLEYLERSIMSSRQDFRERTASKMIQLASPTTTIERSISQILTPLNHSSYIRDIKDFVDRYRSPQRVNFVPEQKQFDSTQRPQRSRNNNASLILYIPFTILTNGSINLISENQLELRDETQNITHVETFNIPQLITTVSQLTANLFGKLTEQTRSFQFVGQVEGKANLIIHCVTTMLCRSVLKYHPESITLDLKIIRKRSIIKQISHTFTSSRVYIEIGRFWQESFGGDYHVDLELKVQILGNHSMKYLFYSGLNTNPEYSHTQLPPPKEIIVFFVGSVIQQSQRTLELIQEFI